jgi:hypothetical protein
VAVGRGVDRGVAIGRDVGIGRRVAVARGPAVGRGAGVAVAYAGCVRLGIGLTDACGMGVGVWVTTGLVDAIGVLVQVSLDEP